MKAAFCIIVLAISFNAGISSFAASHGGAGSGGNLQPLADPERIIVSPEFTDTINLEILRQKLNDPDPFVRVEAVQALGEIHKEQSLVSVCACLNDENIYVRAYAAEALGRIGRVDISLTLAKLLSALDDPSPYVRAMMIAALGELQDEKAADSIRKLLLDDDESVRKMAAWALDTIENSQ